ncbi:MAG: isoleucine--tRNA ligase [Schleiferiaceae bacterium]
MNKYAEYSKLDLTAVQQGILEYWKENKTFEKSIETREGNEPFVFYEGPPSANGLPGIHHVMSRTIKDIFCRYKTQQGFQVKRKAGWDTHGLPVELGVEKELGITKEDIGTKITVEEYNQACRKAVMRYTDIWNNLTEQMGYWVDMSDPYITYKTKYIESVWWLLKQLDQKDLLYKGYTIQPYSPKAGTGLSSHELNQPGTYKPVKDATVIAMFKAVASEKTQSLWGDQDVSFLAWTTTPWTLPSNTALTVGEKIKYSLIHTVDRYSGNEIKVVLASDLVKKYFSADLENTEIAPVKTGAKNLPWKRLAEFSGADLVGISYEQLLPYAQPMEDAEKAFVVIPGDFVTTEDGTGIVHTAPTFGADDARVAAAAGVPPMLVEDASGNPAPLVDLQGRFVDQMGDLAGKYVKNEYYTDGDAPDKSVDVEIVIKLKEEGKAFLSEKYEHSYPHCWRTDKPILYYPLDSWFIRSTAKKEELIQLNKTIQWKPASTGTGRFGNWLENLNDWNLSRSRFWGIPLPIWRNEEGTEQKLIGSMEELKAEIEKSVAAGHMEDNPLADFEVGNMDEANYDQVDLHRPYADRIVLVSDSGQPMKRESDLIDVWFDSGSMPYAQWHYPFENKELIDEQKFYPADFIAEGVDQTRGWFFTLHAIGTMVFDSVAYKTVMSNGLVLDKTGQKMSKRLGNAVEPFEALSTYGADAIRWYMLTNAQPWDNLKFDLDGVTEVQRKFFGTLYNTYSFFALYANVDGFTFAEDEIPVADRPEIDRWILSELNSLIAEVQSGMDAFEPTRSFRAIQDFVTEYLSNWYVRLCRRRFWKGSYEADKIAAYQTLYTCLETVAKLGAPLAPFFMDRLYMDLNSVSGREDSGSVHISKFPVSNADYIDSDLEERMEAAQQMSSMVLSLRQREKIKVRQPLQKISIPVTSQHQKDMWNAVRDLVLAEVNVKEMELVEDASVFSKKAKADFKKLGPKYGKIMKFLAGAIAQLSQDDIIALEANGSLTLNVQDQEVIITTDEVEVITQDIPGMLVLSEGGFTVALDVTISPELRTEGLAREMVNRLQNMRKDAQLEVTDRIVVTYNGDEEITNALKVNAEYIQMETLADELVLDTELTGAEALSFDGVTVNVKVEKTQI